MNLKMKGMAAICFSVALLSGCSSMSMNTKDTLVGGGIGATAGGVIGKVFGGGMGAGIGAAVGGGIGAWMGHEHALKKTRALAQAAEAQHLNPVLQETQVKNASGKEVEALSRFVLPLNPADVEAHGQGSRELLLKAGAIADGNKASQPITVELYGTRTELQWMAGVIGSELNDKNLVQLHVAQRPRLELTPVPKVKAGGAQ